MHGVPFAWTSVKGLPKEEGVIRHGEGADGSKEKREQPGTKAENSKGDDDSYTYETVEESEEEEKPRDDEDPEEADPLESETLEEFYSKRVFTFIHHFAGPRDPLSRCLKLEATRQGIRLKVISVEKSCGTGLGGDRTLYDSSEVGTKGLRGRLSCRFPM